MKNLIKGHIQRLVEEQASLLRWLMLHSPEDKTMLYAAVQLGVEWNKLKVIFWLAVLGELDEKTT